MRKEIKDLFNYFYNVVRTVFFDHVYIFTLKSPIKHTIIILTAMKNNEVLIFIQIQGRFVEILNNYGNLGFLFYLRSSRC